MYSIHKNKRQQKYNMCILLWIEKDLVVTIGIQTCDYAVCARSFSVGQRAPKCAKPLSVCFGSCIRSTARLQTRWALMTNMVQQFYCTSTLAYFNCAKVGNDWCQANCVCVQDHFFIFWETVFHIILLLIKSYLYFSHEVRLS